MRITSANDHPVQTPISRAIFSSEAEDVAKRAGTVSGGIGVEVRGVHIIARIRQLAERPSIAPSSPVKIEIRSETVDVISINIAEPRDASHGQWGCGVKFIIGSLQMVRVFGVMGEEEWIEWQFGQIGDG